MIFIDIHRSNYRAKGSIAQHKKVAGNRKISTSLSSNTTIFFHYFRSTGDLIPGSRTFFSKWSSTSHDRKITLVCDKALK